MEQQQQPIIRQPLPPPPPTTAMARSHDRDRGGTSLIDILDRILDKGIVIAGDISISLLDIELLTIKLRLLVASVEKAKEMGIDWWQHDPQLTAAAAGKQHKVDDHGNGTARLEEENRTLRERLERLERRLNALPAAAEAPAATKRTSARRRSAKLSTKG